MARPLKHLFAIFAFGIASLLPAGVYRVETVNGVPLILKDGIPRSSRMLYVNPQPQVSEAVTAEWREYSVELPTVSRNASNPSIHFRFDPLEGMRRCELGGFRLYDETEQKPVKEWKLQNPLSREIVIGNIRRPDKRNPGVEIVPEEEILAVSSEGLTGVEMRSFVIRFTGFKVKEDHCYSIRFRARSEKPGRLLMGIFGYPETDGHSHFMTRGPAGMERQIRYAADAGVGFITFPIRNFWLPGNEIDHRKIDRIYRSITAANPEAELIVRIDLQTVPQWWAEQHPEEMMKFEQGNSDGYPSIASEQYRHDAIEVMRKVIRFSETNYEKNMAGYHPCGGNTHEWFYYKAWNNALSGYDAATERAFRKFLQKKYPDDTALQRAWNRPGASRAQAAVPSPEERMRSTRKGFYSPEADAAVLDFIAFQQESMAECVNEFASAIRQETGRKRLSIFFYGYGNIWGNAGNGPGVSGHYALRKVLGSPDIDILAAPISYTDRALGDASNTMAAAESVTAAGRLWLQEDDTCTHISTRRLIRIPGFSEGAKTPEESRFLLRRNLAVETLRNFGTWWMDLSGQGAFDSPALWEEMKRMAPVEKALLSTPHPFVPEVAVLLDERSMQYCAPVRTSASGRTANRTTTGPLICSGGTLRNRIGASSGQYLLDDLLSGRITPKMNIVLAAFALDRTQREKLRKISGASAMLWCWAPGYIDPDAQSMSTENIEALTGFKVRRLNSVTPETAATAAGIRFGLPPRWGREFKEAATPLFSPVPRPGDTVLANFTDGSPAVVLRPGKFPAVYCGTTSIPPCYRQLAKLAGISLEVDGDANITANGDFISVTAVRDGKVTVNTGSREEISDALSGESLGRGPKVSFELKRGETRILRSRKTPRR
ncbi:MAG: hypothetical protein HPZ91_10680 [Lentisphaeria bacterium]|nr:hypothetical protein [Lentisphaeria bacterium]